MLGNWVEHTTVTTGTGALTLSSVSGYPGIGDWFGDGDLVAYSIVNGSGQPIESGIGTWTAASSTLARTFVQATYSGSVLAKSGGAIAPASLTGTNTVYVSSITGTFAPGRRTSAQTGLVSGNPLLVGAFPDGYVNPQGGSAAANVIYLSEFCHKSPRQIKGFRVFVGTASGNIQFALYRMSASGALDKQLCATGSKPTAAGLTSYALASPIWLPPDYYACAVQVDNGSASFRLGYGYGNTIFGPDSGGYPTAFMTSSPGSFGLPSPWSGSLTAVGGVAAGPLVYVEYV